MDNTLTSAVEQRDFALLVDILNHSRSIFDDDYKDALEKAIILDWVEAVALILGTFDIGYLTGMIVEMVWLYNSVAVLSFLVRLLPDYNWGQFLLDRTSYNTNVESVMIILKTGLFQPNVYDLLSIRFEQQPSRATPLLLNLIRYYRSDDTLAQNME